MPPLMLKTLRFFVPAGMLYLFLVGVCWYSHWCELAMPKTYEEITKSIIALVLGFVYSVSYLRELSNRVYFEAVNKNLVRCLTSPFSTDLTVPQGLKWDRVRNAFYHFVDKDESLKHQTGLAYWNGALWTSAADLRTISCIACVLTVFFMLGANLVGDSSFDTVRATYFFLMCILLFLASIWFSKLTTRRHIEIGTQQCQFILAQYRDELRTQLIKVAK